MSSIKNGIQDQVLNTLRKQKVDVMVYLTNGVPLRGRIVSFDNFTVILESEGKHSLVYKHAMSTVAFSKQIELEEPSNKSGSKKEEKSEEMTEERIEENQAEENREEA